MSAAEDSGLRTISDVRSAVNRIDAFGNDTIGNNPKVQWAAEKAIEALVRLNIEVNIAREDHSAEVAARMADGHRRTAAGLRRLRTKRA
ncbi:hypothetical protein PBI_PIPEFISH_2 [Mycobacterium phage Pipefish]|uniref:Uncharacterized protein n=1 Tax=Mycobacterium phage Pipefish TaxID=373413 RepID=Q19Z03_9CAUD|nr:gp2 [Mycobacterium phage Pipefish]ABD58499.1 hypothetical protein PBI_PIPEFISH_2 [Mycobacterium phage Pipefish]